MAAGLVDTEAGGDTWDGAGDSDAGVGDTRGGGRAADQTLRGYFVNRIREEGGSRNTLPG